MTIKSVDVRSVARLAAAIYGIFGLIAGVLISLAAAAGFSLNREVAASAPWMGPFLGLGAIIALPLIYCLLGYLGGAIGAWVFNNASRAMGGLKIVVEEER